MNVVSIRYNGCEFKIIIKIYVIINTKILMDWWGSHTNLFLLFKFEVVNLLIIDYIIYN